MPSASVLFGLVIVIVREADLVESVTEVAVTFTVLLAGVADGAEKSVATPLGMFVALNAPQFALPHVTVQTTPALATSLATIAVSPAPPDTCSEVGLGPMVTEIAGRGLFVRLNVAGVDTPAVEALTVKVPVAAFAVKIWDVAAPLEFVVSVSVADAGLVANIPLAPDVGAVNVTGTPFTGLPPLSVTVATNGLPNAVLTIVLCPPPLLAVMVAGVPLVFVMLKLADVLAPEVDAVTV